MAASIPWNELRDVRRHPLRVLDPMAGSGTTLVVAPDPGPRIDRFWHWPAGHADCSGLVRWCQHVFDWAYCGHRRNRQGV